MKISKLKMLPIVFAAMALTIIGCEKKQASELNIDDIPDKVTVEGFVRYVWG